MPSLNKILLMGHLGQDPELRYAPSGNAVCSFSMAVDSGYGEKKKTVWWEVLTFSKQAETVKQYLHKGSLAFVDGETIEDEWVDKNTGAKRQRKKVIARDVKFMDSKPKDAEPAAEKKDDDLPFAVFIPLLLSFTLGGMALLA